MKGHMQDGKFHPHTDYKKGVRKSRDQSTKSTGVKIRKARCTTCQEFKSTLEMGSPSNVCLDCMKKDIPTGFCPVCNRNISRGSENEVKQHIKDHIQMQEHEGHTGVCDCGNERKAREVHSDFVRDPNLPSVSGKGRLKCRHCGRLTSDEFADLGCDCQLPDDEDENE
jgi:hypothetical protein